LTQPGQFQLYVTLDFSFTIGSLIGRKALACQARGLSGDLEREGIVRQNDVTPESNPAPA
jgi:hypothetical protein